MIVFHYICDDKTNWGLVKLMLKFEDFKTID